MLFAVIPASADGGTSAFYMYVQTGNTGRLHLRALPTANSQSLGLFYNGTAVLVESTSNGWALVQVNGQRGYMSLNCLTAVPPTNPTVTPVPTEYTTLYVRTGNTGKLHLREYASQNARSLGLFPNGTLLYAADLGNGWSYVTVNGLNGYMMNKYLAVSSSDITPAPATPVPVPADATMMVVSTGNSGKLHLRENMSTDAASLGLYPNGTQVAVIYNYGAWAYVNVAGKTGFMMTRYLVTQSGTAVTPTPAPDVTAAPLFTATVHHPNNSFVYLRATTNSESTTNVICQVPSGSAVTVVEWGDWWSKIRYNGLEGYMVTQYLK